MTLEGEVTVGAEGARAELNKMPRIVPDPRANPASTSDSECENGAARGCGAVHFLVLCQPQARSNRSAFITRVQAEMKSRTNFPPASAEA